jgi:Mrp family chromosome partitioning ATPase
VTDALLLAQHADITLLVVQHNMVDKKVVKRNLAALRRVAPNVLGAVLNAVDVKSTSHYDYYHYSSSPDKEAAQGDTKPRSRPVPAAG